MGTRGSRWTGECGIPGSASPTKPGVQITGHECTHGRCILEVLLPLPASSLISRFVIYKLPAQSGSQDAELSGLRYKYLDGRTGGWRDGVGSIGSSAGALGRSLQPLYKTNTSQVPGGPDTAGWDPTVGPAWWGRTP